MAFTSVYIKCFSLKDVNIGLNLMSLFFCSGFVPDISHKTDNSSAQYSSYWETWCQLVLALAPASCLTTAIVVLEEAVKHI